MPGSVCCGATPDLPASDAGPVSVWRFVYYWADRTLGILAMVPTKIGEGYRKRCPTRCLMPDRSDGMCVAPLAAAVFAVQVHCWFVLEVQPDSRCGLRTEVGTEVLKLGRHW